MLSLLLCDLYVASFALWHSNKNKALWWELLSIYVCYGSEQQLRFFFVWYEELCKFIKFCSRNIKVTIYVNWEYLHLFCNEDERRKNVNMSSITIQDKDRQKFNIENSD